TVPAGYTATTFSSASIPLSTNTVQNYGIAQSTTTTPTPTPTNLAVTASVFDTGKLGVIDEMPRQLVRTNTDKLYMFGGLSQYSYTLEAYWTGAAGLPNSKTDF